MNRLLSETHPKMHTRFVQENWIKEGEEWDSEYEDLLTIVTETTVDVVEHERLEEEIDKYLKENVRLMTENRKMYFEVERLKKELDKLKYDSSRMICEAAEKSFIDGERLQIEKVRKALKEFEDFLLAEAGQSDWTVEQMKKHFNLFRNNAGLSKEVKK